MFGTELYPGMVVPKLYIRGLGYSASSGPQVGGFGTLSSPREYSSTFYGSNVKQLLPYTYEFSKRKKKSSTLSCRRCSTKSVKKRKRSKSSKKSR